MVDQDGAGSADGALDVEQNDQTTGDSADTGNDGSDSVDWQAKASEFESELKKVRNDFKAMQGERRTWGERDTAIFGLEAKLDGLSGTIATLINGIAGGKLDDDEGRGELARVLGEQEQKTAQTIASGEFKKRASALLASLKDAMLDSDGNQVVEANDPDMAPLGDAWDEALKARDLAGLAMVVPEVAKLARLKERENQRRQLQEEKARAKAERDKTLSETGAYDTMSQVNGTPTSAAPGTWGEVAAMPVAGKDARELKKHADAVANRYFEAQKKR